MRVTLDIENRHLDVLRSALEAVEFEHWGLRQERLANVMLTQIREQVAEYRAAREIADKPARSATEEGGVSDGR